MKQRAGSLAVAAVAATAALIGHAEAGWRDDLGVFRIGVLAEPGAGQSVHGLARITDAYSTVLAMPVEVFVAKDLVSLVDAQAAGRIEYAIYPATAYALAERLCGCVEPVAAPLGASGATGLRAVMIGRRGKADDVAKLEGARLAMPRAGHAAIDFLVRGGLAGQGIDVEGRRATIVEADSVEAAEKRFLEGAADVVVGWEEAGMPQETAAGTATRLVAAGADPADLVVIWRSEPVRYGPHTLRSDLDPEVRQLLLPFLLGLRDVRPDIYDLVETHHGGGYAEVGQSDYASALAMVDHIAATTDP
ncbi:MAG: PhnD/SsuA/transferrin family substrate-binding protein [Rhizobiaceae bacterium]